MSTLIWISWKCIILLFVLAFRPLLDAIFVQFKQLFEDALQVDTFENSVWDCEYGGIQNLWYF